LGAAFGSLLAGPLSDTFGRKKSIIVCDILFTMGALLMGLATSISMLIFGRFIVGVSGLPH
jgi:MFS family permease